jgi:hypothetical protein
VINYHSPRKLYYYCDISKSKPECFLIFVDVGRLQNQDNNTNGDTFVLDMGIGLPFRSGNNYSNIIININ